MTNSNGFAKFALAFVAVLLLGAAPHVDEQLNFTVKGEVHCARKCGQTIVALIGSHLGDPVAEKELSRTELGQSGGAFVVSGSVLVGYQGQPPVPPSERTVTLEIRTTRCRVLKKTLPVNDFARDKYGYLLDVGRVNVKCLAKEG